jgi:hypothetical protein
MQHNEMQHNVLRAIMRAAAAVTWDVFNGRSVPQIDIVLTRQSDGNWAVDWQPAGEGYLDGLVLYRSLSRTSFVTDGELTDVPRDQFVAWLESTPEAWPDSIHLVEAFLNQE